MGTPKSEVVKIITAIKTQCPEALQTKNETERELLIGIWYDILKDYPKELVWLATKKALKNTVYQKQNWIGAICQEIEKMQEAQGQTEMELWDELTRVINRRVRRYEMFMLQERIWLDGERVSPVEELAKDFGSLNPLLKAFVGGVNELLKLSRADTLEFEKARFIKLIPTIKEREKTRKETEAFAGLIESVAGQTKLLTD